MGFESRKQCSTGSRRTDPLVISRSSRSMVPRYSWANKTVHGHDPITLALTPLLRSHHSHTRRTKMSSTTADDWVERSKPASLSGFSVVPDPRSSPGSRAVSRASARRHQLPPALRSWPTVCSFYPHDARQAMAAMAVLERTDASDGPSMPTAAQSHSRRRWFHLYASSTRTRGWQPRRARARRWRRGCNLYGAWI
jgi:hypothetical protein